MTTIIHARNVNEAFAEGWWKLKTSGTHEQSRNGPVLVMPGPVVTEYQHPEQRVLFNEHRDANHTFHLMEAIWMLAGRSDAAWLMQFNPRMGEYAETNGILHGAYGHRWRAAFGHDQIVDAVRELRNNPESRRCVISMWSPTLDQGVIRKDLPCNTQIYFDLRNDQLNMTVTNRSNDMLWGAYGANAVHFSVLQELMAMALVTKIGVYRQFSNNFHVYTDVPMVQEFLINPPVFEPTIYPGAIPLLDGGETLNDFLLDAQRFCDGRATRCLFFTRVAEPMRMAFFERRAGRSWEWALKNMIDCDWKRGFEQWATRRTPKKDHK